MTNPFIEEMRWRGMLQDIMPGTAEQLNKELTSAYVGFDPTADSLHIGSLVPILLLVHLQRAGHKPYALVGGATGMVGDPSGKSEERNMLSEEVLAKNMAGVKAQLEKFLDFDPAKNNAAVMVNNFDWFKNISFLDFIRDAGKHITVNYMMAKDSVKKRLEGDSGMSFTEFTYQLVQGYDFYWLYKNKNCKLQMGGSDQWGNIVTGTELIRRKEGGEAFAFTCPLIKKADGTKFGKSEQGNVWLDAEKTSPLQFYQFWLNASDMDSEVWIKIFTFLSRQTIDDLITQHRSNPSERILQKTLGKELTIFVHGETAYESALAQTITLFANKNLPAESLSEDDLNNLEGVKKSDFDLEAITRGTNVIDFLVNNIIFSSKGEARRFISGGGLYLNRKKVESSDFIVEADHLLHNKYILVTKGKNNYLVKAV